MSTVDAVAALDAWVDELSGRGSGSPPWMDTRSRFDADYLVLQPTQWTQRDLEFRQPGVFRDATIPVGWHGVQGSIAGVAPGLVRPDKSHQEGGVRVNEEWDW